MKRAIVLVVVALLVAGCPVEERQMHGCAAACSGRGVLRVTAQECVCVGGEATRSDGGAR